MSSTLSVRRWTAFAQGGWLSLDCFMGLLTCAVPATHVYTCTWKKADGVFHCKRKDFVL